MHPTRYTNMPFTLIENAFTGLGPNRVYPAHLRCATLTSPHGHSLASMKRVCYHLMRSVIVVYIPLIIMAAPLVRRIRERIIDLLLKRGCLHSLRITRSDDVLSSCSALW